MTTTSPPSRADAELLAQLLQLVSEPVRVRLLFALADVAELCVGDLVAALGDVSEDQASYALKLLRTGGLLQTRREGRSVFYRLADGFPRRLLDHCLPDLLAIATQRSR